MGAGCSALHRFAPLVCQDCVSDTCTAWPTSPRHGSASRCLEVRVRFRCWMGSGGCAVLVLCGLRFGCRFDGRALKTVAFPTGLPTQSGGGSGEGLGGLGFHHPAFARAGRYPVQPDCPRSHGACCRRPTVAPGANLIDRLRRLQALWGLGLGPCRYVGRLGHVSSFLMKTGLMTWAMPCAFTAVLSSPRSGGGTVFGSCGVLCPGGSVLLHWHWPLPGHHSTRLPTVPRRLFTQAYRGTRRRSGIHFA